MTDLAISMGQNLPLTTFQALTTFLNPRALLMVGAGWVGIDGSNGSDVWETEGWGGMGHNGGYALVAPVKREREYQCCT